MFTVEQQRSTKFAKNVVARVGRFACMSCVPGYFVAIAKCGRAGTAAINLRQILEYTACQCMERRLVGCVYSWLTDRLQSQLEFDRLTERHLKRRTRGVAWIYRGRRGHTLNAAAFMCQPPVLIFMSKYKGSQMGFQRYHLLLFPVSRLRPPCRQPRKQTIFKSFMRRMRRHGLAQHLPLTCLGSHR